MKSIIYALNILVMGLGGILASQLVSMVNLWKPHWIPSDLDDGYLEYYYFLMAAIMMVTLLAFIPCAVRYQYKPGTDVSNMEPLIEKEYDLSNKARIRSQSMNQ